MKCLMVSDDCKPTVLSGWSRPADATKKIEQVGKSYEKLKQKYHDLRERMEKGASAHFESEAEEEEKIALCKACKKVPCACVDEEPEQEKNENYEKKRHTKTKQ